LGVAIVASYHPSVISFCLSAWVQRLQEDPRFVFNIWNDVSVVFNEYNVDSLVRIPFRIGMRKTPGLPKLDLI